MGTSKRHALFASTLTTRELLVMVFIMSMLFKLNVFELFNTLVNSAINLNWAFTILNFDKQIKQIRS